MKNVFNILFIQQEKKIGKYDEVFESQNKLTKSLQASLQIITFQI